MPTRTPTESAAAQVETWRNRVADLTAAIATAGREMIEADDERRHLAVRAASGDAKATARLAELRRQRAEIEAGQSDLRLALDEAGAQLAQAETVHAAAVRAAVHARARTLADQRIEVALAFDAAAAALTAAYGRWDALGREMIGLDLDQYRGNTLSAIEAVTGSTRIQRAFPPVVLRAFPHAVNVFAGGDSLAESEAAQWLSLPAA